MAKNPTWLLVVAAVLRDDRGRLLLQRALAGKPHGGMWEFPGGKVESGENPRFALRREIAEELGLMLDEQAMAPIAFADAPAEEAGPTIVLILYDCPAWHGEPEAREGQAWGWFTPADAAALAMPPIDRTLLDAMGSRGGLPTS